jgi:hypothetical protein
MAPSSKTCCHLARQGFFNVWDLNFNVIFVVLHQQVPKRRYASFTKYTPLHEKWRPLANGEQGGSVQGSFARTLKERDTDVATKVRSLNNSLNGDAPIDYKTGCVPPTYEDILNSIPSSFLQLNSLKSKNPHTSHVTCSFPY